jgi:hypothetical protein
MLRYCRNILAGAVMLGAFSAAFGFSLLGPGGAEGNPAKQWQLPAQQSAWDIGYDEPGLDVGSPVDPLEAYRWNVPIITYAYDEGFIRYFGTNGMKVVDDAVRIFNELPPVSRMSKDLSEFPLNTSHLHHEAAQLGLMDLKSVAMNLLVEHLGLADSVRWTWAIRNRDPIPGTDFGVYTIIRYNYDPVTLRPSSYVNGNLRTYFILEIPPPVQFADAVEQIPVGLETEPLNIPVSSLSSVLVLSGYYYTGLTRDDVGGLRFLYNPRNIVTETLLPGILPGVNGWSPFLGTNFLGSNVVITNIVTTNNIATVGLRGGMNNIRFRKVFFDSLLGQAFTPITNQYIDRAIATNSQLVSQSVLRPITQPDIVFTVTDLLGAIADRTTTAGWLNNDLINGAGLLGGPGVITPPALMSFNSNHRFLINVTPFFVTEPDINDPTARLNGLIGPVWASFDGSTNAPIIYPAYLNYTINDIRSIARGGGP